MAMYRATRLIKSASRGMIQPGQRTRLEWLPPDDIATLLRKGIVRQEESPDLADLAGWKTRAARLERLQIKTIDEFLEADPDWLAGELHVKQDTIKTWCEQLKTWMTAPSQSRRG